MSRWTSERAIERDLRRAQGAAAASPPRPRALRAAERPPRAALIEETEEEYLKQCAGGGGGAPPRRPDLGLIQQMLNMVRDLNVPEDEFDDTDVAVISKLNPERPEFIPMRIPPVVNLTQKKGKVKKIRQRNIALESILQALECEGRAEGTDTHDVPLKLLKPEDLIRNSPECGTPPRRLLQEHSQNNDKSTEIDTSREKVKDWLTQTQMNSSNEIKPVSVILESTNMFKRKSKPSPGVSPTCLKADIIQDKSHKAQTDRRYIPSTKADDYYKKYLDKSQLMDALHDDIWTKAEKKMKQVDEKRRLAAEQRAAEGEGGGGAGGEGEEADPAGDVLRLFQARVDSRHGAAGWARVRLPSARHPPAERAPCAVCRALTRPHPTPAEELCDDTPSIVTD